MFDVLTFEKKTFQVDLIKNDEGTITETVLYDGEKVLARYHGHFKEEKKAVYYVLKKYYLKAEGEYVDRARRINYALGESQTIEELKQEFKYTKEGRILQEAMRNANSSNGT